MATIGPVQIGALIAQVGYWQPVGQRIGGTPPRDLTPPDVKKRIVDFYDTAIAVCLAESGGNTAAKNPGSSASGLWQIMVSVHEDKIKEARQEVYADVGRLGDIFDPLVNTAVAAKVYNAAGKSWRPWEVYTTGAYQKHRGHGAKVYAALYSPANIAKGVEAIIQEQAMGIETTLLAVDPTGAIRGASAGFDIASDVMSFVKQGAVTVGAFVVGALLVILGIWFVISETKVGKGIKGVASMTPIGRAKKVLKP